MSELLYEIQDRTGIITLNRVHCHNAFDDIMLHALQNALDEAIANPAVRLIVLRANGQHFSAGADLAWMQRMAHFSEAENLADAHILAKVMRTLYESPKPTMAVVQGSAIGGGAGLVAACDIAIASTRARFCFSEVMLGLIPAVISPYVIKAIGERAAKCLFISAERFEASKALNLGLIHHCVSDEELWPFALECAQKISGFAPEAVAACKPLVSQIAGRAIDDQLVNETASLIAEKRVSLEGQKGLHAFLHKKIPHWN